MAKAFDPYHRWLGIPPADQPPNHYRLLGLVLYESDPEVIESAADRQMAHVRTFQAGRYSEQSQTILNELAAAKNCLLKRAQKAEYDQALRAKLDAAPSLPTSNLPVPVAVAPAQTSPRAATIPLAPQSIVAPRVAPSFAPQTAPLGRSQPATPISRPSHRSNRSSTAIVVALGVAFLLVAGVVIWQVLPQFNRNHQQELAAKLDSINTPTTPPKPPTKKTTVPPAEAKSAPIPQPQPQPQPPPVAPAPLIDQPVIPPPVTSPPVKTPPVSPPPAVVSIPPTQANPPSPPAPNAIALTHSPNPIVPRVIKLSNSGGIYPIFTPDSAWLLYTSLSRVEVWNLATEKQIGSIPAAFQQCAISTDGKKIAVEEMPASGKGLPETIQIYDLATLKPLHQLARPPDASPKAPFFRVCGFDSTSGKLFTRTGVDVQVWDVQSGQMLRRITSQNLPSNNPSVWSLDGRQIVMPFQFGTHVLDTGTEGMTKNGVTMQELSVATGQRVHSSGQGSWSFTADGKMLYGTEQINGVLLQWSLPDARLNFALAIQDLLFAKISPDNSRLLVELKTDRQILYVLDRASMQVIATLPAGDGNVSSYAISPDNRWIFLKGRQEVNLFDFGPQPVKKP